jgi:WD40 repeat protein
LVGRGFVQLRDVATGKQLLAHNAPAAYCWALSFSPDGSRLATGYEDSTALIWNMAPASRAGMPAKALNAGP